MKQATGNPAPGYKKYPNHRITAKPAAARVQVTFNGEVIADTKGAIELHEPHVGHVVSPVVYYIPRKDVKMDRLARTSHTTHCPFKGDASYWSVRVGEHYHAVGAPSPGTIALAGQYVWLPKRDLPQWRRCYRGICAKRAMARGPGLSGSCRPPPGACPVDSAPLARSGG